MIPLELHLRVTELYICAGVSMCFWWASSSLSSTSSRKKSTSSSRSHGNTAANVGGNYVKAKTGGLTSPESCLLVNQTDRTLYLRDKVGAAFGNTRYKIQGNSEIEVTPLQHTFFKMILYAVEEETETGGSKEEAVVSGIKEKKISTDTKLTIDSDQMADNKKIVIKLSNSGRYELSYTSR